jgi:two-component system LytT family response regulator/two-component system response regulator LytT
VDEVLYCQSRGSYSYVVTNKERFLAVRLLAEWEELLASAGFVRIHRAFLVNVRHIRSLRRVEPDGSGVLVLQTGEELPVSRRRFATVVATLQRGV